MSVDAHSAIEVPTLGRCLRMSPITRARKVGNDA